VGGIGAADNSTADVTHSIRQKVVVRPNHGDRVAAGRLQLPGGCQGHEPTIGQRMQAFVTTKASTEAGREQDADQLAIHRGGVFHVQIVGQA
jgi:hypothetical protein